MENSFNEKVNPSNENEYDRLDRGNELNRGMNNRNSVSIDDSQMQQHNISTNHGINLVNSNNTVMILQQGSRVVLPSLLETTIDRSVNADTIDAELRRAMVENYTPIDESVVATYAGNDEHMSALDSLVEQRKEDTIPSKTTKEKFEGTLVGKIAQLIRDGKQSLSVDELVKKVAPCFSELRKSDGMKYKGDCRKAVCGALSSVGLFIREEGDKWNVNEKEMREYEEQVKKRFESKGRKRRENDIEANFNNKEKTEKRQYAKRRNRKQGIINTMSQLSEMQRKEGSDRNKVYFQNPFIGLSGTEDCEHLEEKLGKERFTLCMQLYCYFKDVFRMATNEVMLDAQSGSTDDVLYKSLNQLQREMDEVKERMSQMENRIRNPEVLQM